MLHLTRARVPVSVLPPGFAPQPPDPVEPWVACDLTIDAGSISAVSPEGTPPPAGAVVKDLGGSLVFPAFIDTHVHLDKTHTWFRAPNRSATFWEALEVLGRDKDFWTHADLKRRAEFAMRCAWAHGTRVIRTHVDTGPAGSEVSHAFMAELRETWRGRIDLQTVSLTGTNLYSESCAETITRIPIKYGASALGGFSLMTPNLPQLLDRQLAVAAEHGIGIDLHVDENGDPNAEVLRAVAEAVLRTKFPYPVVCGHCCSLAVQPPERRRSTIALVKEAGVRVISLPLCNLYLQDRKGAAFPRSPHWRGLAPLHDLMDAGVAVACASDNVRDAFYAFGDYDMAEVYSQAVRIAHLDTRLAESVGTVTSQAASIINATGYGVVAPGAQARLVVFEGRSFSDLLSRPTAPRLLVDNEVVHTPEIPSYRELAQ